MDKFKGLCLFLLVIFDAAVGVGVADGWQVDAADPGAEDEARGADRSLDSQKLEEPIQVHEPKSADGSPARPRTLCFPLALPAAQDGH